MHNKVLQTFQAFLKAVANLNNQLNENVIQIWKWFLENAQMRLINF